MSKLSRASASSLSKVSPCSSSTGLGAGRPLVSTQSPLWPLGRTAFFSGSTPTRTSERPRSLSTPSFACSVGRRRSASTTSTRAFIMPMLIAVLTAIVDLPSD